MIPRPESIAREMAATGVGELQAVRNLQARAMIRQAAPMGRSHRISSDCAWPLRGADGLTWAERKESAR